MEIRPMTQAEQKYTFKQSMQIESQTCQVGYLRGDFGINGREFHTSWHDTDSRRNTDEFAAEFDSVIHALRSEECGLFASSYDMKRYVTEHSDSAFSDSHRPAYGFRVDTEKHVYLLRCNPSPSDYNFYCYCYEKPWLDRNIEKAAQGIRFKDANYRELFKIPDGGSIVITTAWGEKIEQACRYIDDTHCEVGSNVFHVDEFAERMARNGATYAPKPDTPPKTKQQAR